MDQYDGKYKGNYSRRSHRRPGWNYANDGYYFLTFVTKNRICLFGEIVNKKAVLSDYGQIAEREWHKSFEIRDELFLDEYVIMPNHIHALVVLRNTKRSTVKQPKSAPVMRIDGKQMPYREPKSISSFIGAYKRVVMYKIDDYIDDHALDIPKYNRMNPLWQDNYHDRVIRDDDEYWRIKTYIQNNPENWNNDDLYVGGDIINP